MKAFPLNKHATSRREDMKALFAERHERAFNPSILEHDQHTHLTYRHSEKQGAEVSAFYVHKYSSSINEYCLSEINKSQFNISKVADPKLFTAGNCIWMTFNTGYVRDGNQIYVQKLFPSLSLPIRVTYANRRPMEKNWAFFEQDRELYALYSIDPLKILEVDRGKADEWVLKEKDNTSHPITQPRLSIGTQPVQYGDKMLLIAHRKFQILTRRMYFGSAITLTRNDGEWLTKRSNNLLFHSYRNLMGSRERLNPNLLSCTYFSGLCLRDHHALLTYGINDTSWSAMELTLKQLCD